MDNMEEKMEVDTVNEEVLKLTNSLNVHSAEFRQMVENIAKAFGIVQHPDPLVTLRAIQRRIAVIKTSKAGVRENKKEDKLTLNSLDIGAQTTNSPQLDDAIRILRLLHGVQLRELQTTINELVADVQKVTANPKCDLNLGRIGR